MKHTARNIMLGLALTLSVGASAGVALSSSVEKEADAAANWQSHTVLYANATSYNNLYCRVKRGDDVGWDSHTMSKTSRLYGTKYVYEGEVWEAYGGLNNMYMKSGNAGDDSGTLVQTIFEEWTVTSTWADKLYDGSAWKTVYTVDFNMNDHGTAPSGQYVASGGKVTQPTAPTASGYTFGGWYKEAGCTNAWNFSTDTVTSNKILYAKWTLIVPEYTVIQYKVLDGASPVQIGSETVLQGASYSRPANRYEAGYTFGGWYTNTACTIAYNGSTISGNLNLYAKYTSGTWAGTVNLDLRDSGWADAAANYAIMFMDKTTYPSEITAWSTYVTGTAAGERLVTISYDIPFNPQLMTVVRYKSTYSQSDWNSVKYPEDGNKWGQTPDISVDSIVRIGNTTDGYGNNYAYEGYPQVIGGAGWTNITYLTSVKSNGSHNVEYYGSVTLAANTEFKIQVAPYADGDYYATYSTYKDLEGDFGGGGSSNILAKKGGTYSFYFDSYAGTLYITTVALAAADEWAQYFLAHSGCDATGVNIPSGWTACATEYAKLSGDAKDIVYGASAGTDTYIEKAVARYDIAIRNHPSLTKFIVNSSSTPRTAGMVVNPIAVATNGTTNATVIIVITLTSLSALGGYFFIRRRREVK